MCPLGHGAAFPDMYLGTMPAELGLPDVAAIDEPGWILETRAQHWRNEGHGACRLDYWRGTRAARSPLPCTFRPRGFICSRVRPS